MTFALIMTLLMGANLYISFMMGIAFPKNDQSESS